MVKNVGNKNHLVKKKKKILHEKLFSHIIDVTCYVIFIKYLLF